MRMAISRDSTFDSVKFLILIYPSNMFPLRIGRNKCFKIVFNKILSLGEILARLKWVSMIGDPTFPRIYCARNDAAKGGHVMHLYASAVLIHARYVVIIMPAYTRHNEVLHGQSSPLSFSLMTFHVHIIHSYIPPSSFLHFIFVFSPIEKKIFLSNSIEKSILRIYFHHNPYSFLPFYRLRTIILGILTTILHA